jgi:hypothetical protein
MISFLQPLPIGNAVKVLLAPPDGASVRVLRKPTDDISGYNDVSAALVYQGDGPYFVDVATLTNGTPYYYKPFYTLDAGSTWTSDPSQVATPAATAGVGGCDPLSLVRDRLDAGLKAEVAAGRLSANSKGGPIAVLTAPPTFDNVVFPVVTVHLRTDQSSVRGIGESIASDALDPVSTIWTDSEGYLSKVDLDFIVWVSGNADLRIAMRKAVKKVLVGNLAVFDDAGMLQVDVSISDVEDFDTYEAPMFQAVGTLSCLAPYFVTSTSPSITDANAVAIQPS